MDDEGIELPVLPRANVKITVGDLPAEYRRFVEQWNLIALEVSNREQNEDEAGQADSNAGGELPSTITDALEREPASGE